MATANFPRYPSSNSKYPFVGPNYQAHGEVSGYVYYPWTDQYYTDPKAVKDYQVSTGQREGEKAPQSLLEQLAPVGAVAGTVILGQEAGKNIAEGASGLFGSAKDSLLSIGGSPTQATQAIPGANAALGEGALSSMGQGAAPIGEAAGGMFDLGGIGAQGNMILPIAGAAGAYDVLANDRGPVRGTLQGAASGAAIGSAFGPPGVVPGAVIGGTIGLVKGLFGDHETTREIATKHTKSLLEQGKDDPAWQQYVAGMRAQHESAPPDPSKPFKGGTYSSWEEYKAEGLDASDLTGVYGNLKTFGPDWAKLSFEDQKRVTQGIINAGLYEANKGEVEISDAAKAKEIKDQILSGKIDPATPENPKQTSPIDAASGMFGINKAPAPLQPPGVAVAQRTSTLSPGIGLDGRRIAY